MVLFLYQSIRRRDSQDLPGPFLGPDFACEGSRFLALLLMQLSCIYHIGKTLLRALQAVLDMDIQHSRVVRPLVPALCFGKDHAQQPTGNIYSVP